MFQRTWLLGLVIGLAPAACKGPAGLCLNTSCDAAVPVRVVDDAEAGGKLRDGAYRFVISTDEVEAEWRCAVPAEDCDFDYFTDFEDGEDSGTLSLQARAGETGLDLQVLETRGTVWSGPARFVVQIERDGVMVAEDTFEPRYENYGPADACAVCLTRVGDDELVVHVTQ